MNNNRPKIGLVLGTGAARGIAHIGVLRALEENNIPIDFISGCSMGALIGGFYAAGISVLELEEIALNLNIKKISSLFFPSFARSGIINGDKIEELLSAIIGNKTFQDLKIPLSVITTNAHDGKEVILQEGSVVKAIRASISFPGIFVPVEYKKYCLIDGGIVNPLPVSAIKMMGADLTIVVNVTKNVGEYIRYVQTKKQQKFIKIKEIKTKIAKLFNYKKKPPNFLNNLFTDYISEEKPLDGQFEAEQESKMNWAPNIINVILQTIYIMEAHIAELKLSKEKVDIMVKPEISHVYMLEFHKAKELIQSGYVAGLKAAAEIKKKL